MKITFKKSWNPWRQVRDAEEIIKLWQDYINTIHEEIDRLENALDVIAKMGPRSHRNILADKMANVALEALTAEVRE